MIDDPQTFEVVITALLTLFTSFAGGSALALWRMQKSIGTLNINVATMLTRQEDDRKILDRHEVEISEIQKKI